MNIDATLINLSDLMAPQPDLYLVTYLLARPWMFIGTTNVLQPKVNRISKQIFICVNLPASVFHLVDQ